ncbi:helix-turn-helix transcriptional regulator [Lysinibacillus xylanilyticus]|uniref:helix-turn-helix transcriptional regulator n=1 Tax=Lysinibacillus xylanilyticus TaxID=582475 RepID=UPI00381F315C
MKSARMFSILNLLVNHQKITAQELAEKLEVSKRTIYRDIESLNLEGIPIVSYPGQGGGLGILANYKLCDANPQGVAQSPLQSTYT